MGSESRESGKWLRSVSRAIGAAGLNPDVWHGIPALLAEAWPGAKVLLQGCADRRSLGFLHHGFDDADMARYHDYYCGINPWVSTLQQMPVLRPSPSDNTLPWWTFSDGEFYNDFLKPQGDSEHGVAIKLFDEPNHFAWLGFQFGHGVAPEYNEALSRVLQRLAPALRAALSLNRQIARTSAIATAEHLLAGFDLPALLVDMRGSVVSANGLGAAALDKGDLVRLDGFGRLHLHSPDARAAVERQIGRLLRDKGAAAMDLALRSAEGRVRAVLSLFPVSAGAPGSSDTAWLHAPERFALLLLRDLDATPAAGIEFLQQLFALTAAEARLAARLVAGEAFPQAALALGIGKETARTHLRAVFAKTGTHRQAELVALLARLPHGNRALP